MIKILAIKQVIVIFLSTLLTILSFQTFAQSEKFVQETLEDAAEQYVKLGLELGEYDKDYVDAYLGPKEWRTQAKEQLRTKKQLAEAIHNLKLALKSIPVEAPNHVLRHKALSRNVRAMDIRARMLINEKFSFEQEAKLIYDAKIPHYDFNKFDQALAAIEKLIPGEGDLAQRVDAFRAKFEIPNERVGEVVDLAIAECKKRSDIYIPLPETENFVLEYVSDKSWSGYNWYQGNNQSLMQINLDFPLQIDRAIDLGCHEGYPGHHVWNVLLENNLLKSKKWIEFSIFPLFSPYALIAEGSANYGIELAFPDSQKLQFEKRVLFPKANLAPETASQLNDLNKLTEDLSHSITATAQLYLDGKISRKEAIEQRRKYSLVSQEKAEQSVRFIEQYRAYVLNYNLGKDTVSKYIEAQSQNEKGKWQAFERMLTELSTASDMLK
ncbi:hypothetical protein [Paraglaciecola sp.]|uniref:hypothetical protein n=1 Tax=Paraglaciecola sp. TaxID=1920173 RepID=UPI003EF15AEA